MYTLREWAHRLWGTVRRRRTDADLEEELRSHLALAADVAERRGRESQDARHAARIQAGGISQAMDALRDRRGFPWLDALRADLVFGWRQLNKHRTSSVVAILSLGLAVGATTAAFRLVDAVLLRPLPVADPDRLFVVATTFLDSENRWDVQDDFDYPSFREYSRTVGGSAQLMVVGMAYRIPIVFDPGDEPEQVYRQFYSGNVFSAFGLQPALGRLLGPADDLTPGAHPVAVISYDYWTRRFGRDPAVVGRTFPMGNQRVEIVGVAPKGFTGTEPGSLTDLFLPAMMNSEAIDHPGWSWFRIWVRPAPGISPERVRLQLQARFKADHQQRVKSFPPDTPRERIDAYLNEDVLLLPSGSGASGTQKAFRRPLIILAALAGLVLLIACGNVANLLISQAMARTREMVLRVAIGAGRRRLIQLVLVESALLAIFASAVGALFASWSAPVVVSMLASPERTVMLILDTDWRALVFGISLTIAITLLFGLAPALHASSVRPIGALKACDDSRTHRRLTKSLIAVQMAFCVSVVFVAGLFVTTLGRLSNQPLGFSPRNVLVIQGETRGKPHSPEVWTEIADRVRQIAGVESAAFAGWTFLSDNRWRSSVLMPGRPAEPRAPYFLSVSRGFFDTMRMGMIDGRDFRAGDMPPNAETGTPMASVGIVNEAFARGYFDGRNPIGSIVTVRQGEVAAPMEIVGLVRDAVYFSVRETVQPTVYVPVEARGGMTLLVRTAGDPMAYAAALRREVTRARPDVRVRQVFAHSALVERQMIRERLLATLSLFFAAVALLLAAVGLFGVLNYAVIQQRREIGIRMALGARAAHIVRRVTTQVLVIVCVGSLAGLAAGLAFARVIQSLLFNVKPTDPLAVLTPILILSATAALAALSPALRAARIDPAQTLRSE